MDAATRQAETRERENLDSHEAAMEERRRAALRERDDAVRQERLRCAEREQDLRERCRRLEAKAVEAEDLARARDTLEQAARNNAAETRRRLEAAEARHAADVERLGAERDAAAAREKRRFEELKADAIAKATEEVDRVKRESAHAIETARRDAEEAIAKLVASRERVERDWRLADQRADAAEGEAASLLEAARAAEALLERRAEKTARLERRVEDDAKEKAHLWERLEYAEWRLGKLGVGGERRTPEEMAVAARPGGVRREREPTLLRETDEEGGLGSGSGSRPRRGGADLAAEAAKAKSGATAEAKGGAKREGVHHQPSPPGAAGPSADDSDASPREPARASPGGSSVKSLAAAFEQSPRRAEAEAVLQRVKARAAEEDAKERRGPGGVRHHNEARARDAPVDTRL